ncbi:hypothetical protein MRX96_045211 [Rhipicephalus microplus]
MPTADLIVLIMIPAVQTTVRPLAEWQVELGPAAPGHSLAGTRQLLLRQHSALKSAAGGGFPAMASGAMGGWEALLDYTLRESNKTVVRQPGDDYDELDNI